MEAVAELSADARDLDGSRDSGGALGLWVKVYMSCKIYRTYFQSTTFLIVGMFIYLFVSIMVRTLNMRSTLFKTF